MYSFIAQHNSDGQDAAYIYTERVITFFVFKLPCYVIIFETSMFSFDVCYLGSMIAEENGKDIYSRIGKARKAYDILRKAQSRRAPL